MAVPTVTFTGSASSKTSGTTLAITVTSTAYELGDCLVVGFSMDPATGAVSFAQTGGTATIGAFTTEGDVATGSGTSGIRTVLAWAQVTAAGTITTVTVTHPTATARAAETFNASGIDGSFPVSCSTTISGVSDLGQIFPPVGGVADVAGLLLRGFEIVAGTTVGSAGSDWTQAATGDWILSASDSVTVGTTGGASASNISVAYTVCAPTPTWLIDTGQISITIENNTITNACVAVVFKASEAPYMAMATTTGA